MTDLEVMMRERECIIRNDGVNCDRRCEKCDLVLDVKTILRTYDRVIKMLQEGAIQ